MHLDYVGLRLWVQVPCGLIQQQQLGLADQRPCQTQPLLLPPRQGRSGVHLRVQGRENEYEAGGCTGLALPEGIAATACGRLDS